MRGKLRRTLPSNELVLKLQHPAARIINNATSSTNPIFIGTLIFSPQTARNETQLYISTQLGMTSYSSKDDHPYSDEEPHDVEDPDNTDEVGFDRTVPAEVDLFKFSTFELLGVPKAERIKKMVEGEDCKVVVTDSNRIYRWKFKKEPQFNQFELPDASNFMGVFTRGKERSSSIRNVYMDTKGYHLIITTDTLNHFYLNFRDTKVRPLLKIKNLNILAMAFYNAESDLSTGEIVVASNNGSVSLYRIDIKEEILQTFNPQVLQIPTVSDIQSIEVLRFQQDAKCGGKTLMLLFSTSSSLYCIISPDDINICFKKFQDRSEPIKEMVLSRGVYSMGQVCYSKNTRRPLSYLWTNGNTLYCFKFPERDERLTDNFLSKSDILKYAKRADLDERKAMVIQEMPVAIGMTEFHYYMLHSDCMTIMSKVTQMVEKVYELRGGLALDMAYQRLGSVFWIYSSSNVWRLDASREDTEVWKVLIEKKRFREAYEVSKTTNINLEYVAGLYADDLFAKKEFIEAAKMYTETSRTFEEIFNKFLVANSNKSNEGLEVYLKIWLGKLKPEEKTQRCLLSSWLIELIVYSLNNLERTLKSSPKHAASYQQLIKSKESQLSRILDNNLDVLDENLVYSIMQSHGRIENIVRFAQKKNNFEMIILHHINEENFKVAINNLKRVKDKKVSEVVYKYAHIFFREEIEETVDLLVKHIQEFNPVKLIPGFMNIPPDKRIHGIELLKYCIKELKCRQRSIHNILIFFTATTARGKEQKEELMEILRGGLHFDEDFALRLFKRNNLHEAQILVYGTMGLYREAVNLALDNGQYALAKEYANKPEYDDVKKKLWLEIAQRWLHQGKNVSDVISLTKESKVIKIEDLLPYFNEKIKIEDFKDEICDSLKGYSSQIDRLKKQMESYSSNAQQLKKELHLIENRSVEIDATNKCEECFKLLFNEEFYVFPCMHGFHRQCLLDAIRQQPTSERDKLNRIDTLDSDLRRLKSSLGERKNYKKDVQTGGFSFNPFNLFTSGKDKQQEQQLLSLTKEEKDIKDKKKEFDDLLAAECIYCGPSIVDTITMPFTDDSLKGTWLI